ncbi:hypothetical protein [Photorhabdus temperata]|uniref:hypothetical protein n=1 Tax=Photorhabdus temperata TaxID=574560 RepID=UPI0034DD5D67
MILIPLVIAALFLLPPAAFGLVIIAVSVLAAWEWGNSPAYLAKRNGLFWLFCLLSVYWPYNILCQISLI